jgi:hypothetical protein
MQIRLLLYYRKRECKFSAPSQGISDICSAARSQTSI